MACVFQMPQNQLFVLNSHLNFRFYAFGCYQKTTPPLFDLSGLNGEPTSTESIICSSSRQTQINSFHNNSATGELQIEFVETILQTMVTCAYTLLSEEQPTYLRIAFNGTIDSISYLR